MKKILTFAVLRFVHSKSMILCGFVITFSIRHLIARIGIMIYDIISDELRIRLEPDC
jgi:hypothetical protein